MYFLKSLIIPFFVLVIALSFIPGCATDKGDDEYSPDEYSPAVNSTIPIAGETNVPISTTISAIFNKMMDASTITPSTFSLNNWMTGSVSYDSETYTATFSPDNELNYSTTYTATISASVTDDEGNPLGENYSWSFTTTAGTPDDSGDPWSTKAPLSPPRYDHSSCTLNGKIYVIGGWGYYLIYFSTIEEYDPSADIWTTKSPMPTTRHGHTSNSVNGKIYVIGGIEDQIVPYYSDYITNTVLEYDPEKDTWTYKASMPTKRYHHTSCVVNGKIYVIGGADYEATCIRLNIVEEYDPATDTWTTKTPMPAKQHGHSCSVVNGKIYVIGGYSIIDFAEEYDPITDTWTTKTPMPTDRYNFTSSVVNGKIYAIGGFKGAGMLYVVEEYDPVTDTWTSKTNMPTQRGCHKASVVNGRIYIIGGRDNLVDWPETVYEYNPALDNHDGGT